MPLPPDALHNPAWSSLTTRHRHLAETRGRAVRYPPDVAAFFGLPDAPEQGDWDDAARLVGQEPTFYVHQRPQPPRDWEVLASVTALGMVAPPEVGRAQVGVERLGTEHLPQMVALAAEAPDVVSFRPRMLEVEPFFGVLSGDRLVAMVGFRFRTPAWVELTAAVVSRPWRGRGLGRRLGAHAVQHAYDDGVVPVLLVFEDNPAAGMFRRTGWREHGRVGGRLLRAPAA